MASKETHGKRKVKGKRLPKDVYEKELYRLQAEVVKMQEWARTSGARIVVIFEGRDAAGKGGTIARVTAYLNPRTARIAALPKPTEREASQWYFQRYIAHLPAAGEITLFDRSWYNRAGVEHVMGFCSKQEYARFMHQCPVFERMLVEDGILLRKYWFSVSDEEQQRRFRGRLGDPMRRWKLSPMDLESISRWEDYSRAKDEMFVQTDIPEAPWYVVESDDKRRARVNMISHLLSTIPYHDVPEPKLALPERPGSTGYVRTPLDMQTFVPDHAATLLRQTMRVTSGELRQRAAAMGIDVTYWDWSGHEVRVGDDTLAAILDALGDVPAAGPDLAPPRRAEHVSAPVPGDRSWGFALQLYSLRSRDSWGHGDLRDLADLARWSARDLGADFVLINPLHAAEPLPPVSPSPYLPMTRRYVSPLYLRVEDIPELTHLSSAQRAQLTALSAPLRAAVTSAELIDRDAVWTAKRAALQVIRTVPLSPARQAALDEFKVREGRALRDWATWCALAEVHGADYRSWPAPLRDPRSAEVAVARGGLARPAEFHAWVQWLVAEQVAAAQQAARDAGMSIGIIHDLAVGAHPGGGDAWAGQDAFVRGVSVGAPPDAFNQRGQDWTLPPWHPGRLAAGDYRQLGDLIGAAARHAGGVRIDHVMGLSRLWWIPAGMSPGAGAYVHYNAGASLAVLAAQVSGAGAVAIGEDLGTVEPWLREALAAHGVLGTSMLWFERGWSNEPLAPQWWRRNALVTASTHDMPPAAAFLTGEQVTERATLGLLTRSLEVERAEADRLVADWVSALAGQGLIPGDRPPSADEFTAALYGYLARTPSLLVGVSLAEAVGERRSQNMPGTTTEYPNWKVPLCGPSGSPVLLEDLPGVPVLRATVRAVTGK